MSTLRVSIARIKAVFAASRGDADLDAEIQAHLDLLTAASSSEACRQPMLAPAPAGLSAVWKE